MSKEFKKWWHTEGSQMRPAEGEDLEEFMLRITGIAWSNGSFCAYKPKFTTSLAISAKEILMSRLSVEHILHSSGFPIEPNGEPFDGWGYMWEEFPTYRMYVAYPVTVEEPKG